MIDKRLFEHLRKEYGAECLKGIDIQLLDPERVRIDKGALGNVPAAPDVQLIMSMYREGVSIRQIARRLDMRRQSVTQIIKQGFYHARRLKNADST